MSITSIRETLLQEVSVLPADYCPKVLHFIESLKEDEDSCEDWSDEQWKEWLASNPPIPVEDDPTITPEHLERLRQRSKDVDEGRTKVIPFTDEELEEFWQEIQHSPEQAIAKAESRAYYLTPKQS
jgi:hypothetical protein